MLSARHRRRGVTLLELVVSLTLGALVLGIIVMISVRQQRVYTDASNASALAAQLRDAESVLPIDIRAASAAAGDLRSGEARDTAIELRGTIATAVVCDTAGSRVLLAPVASTSPPLSSFLTTPRAGDTAWIYTPSDSSADWAPYAISAFGSAPPGACAPGGPVLDSMSRSVARASVALPSLTNMSTVIGSAMRVTRPVRYSLYRGGDGQWYLGQREWNPGVARFDAVQPLSGPYSPPSQRGLAFSYVDSAGRLIAAPVADTRLVALVRVELRGQSKTPELSFGAAGSSAHTDSTVFAVRLRNPR